MSDFRLLIACVDAHEFNIIKVSKLIEFNFKTFFTFLIFMVVHLHKLVVFIEFLEPIGSFLHLMTELPISIDNACHWLPSTEQMFCEPMLPH